jgi:hypothetical protein
MPDGLNSPEALGLYSRPETLETSQSQPASLFAHPSAALAASAMSGSDKRALLAAWASDASAVGGQPALRWLPGTPEPVAVDDILGCLQALDREGLH